MHRLLAAEKMANVRAVALVLYSALTYTVFLQSQSTLRDLRAGDSTVKHINSAEVRSIEEGSLFDPEHQREVYWHDPDWKIDLLVSSSGKKVNKVSVVSNVGTTKTVELPSYYAQIDEILRGPGDKAIVVEEDGSSSEHFSIIDLIEGKLIAPVPSADVEISPDRRFVFFQRWVARFDTDYENRFAIYDLLKSPRENVCSYSEDDPRHEHIELATYGFQVYPQRRGRIDCATPDDLNDDNHALKFSWAADSSKFVFADVKSNILTLILVLMPVGTKDLPKTLVYPLTGAQDVCEGATDAAGNTDCSGPDITFLGWDDNAVKAVFHHRFGTPLDLNLTIPLSQFVPNER